MTFKDKIKRALHKKTPSTSGSPPNSSPGSSTTAASPTKSSSKSVPSTSSPTATHGPNNPPNARDPGFRKSFNLGEQGREQDWENTNTRASTDTESNQLNANTSSPPRSIPVSAAAGGNGSSERNLSSVSTLDGEAAARGSEWPVGQAISKDAPLPVLTASVLESRLPLSPAQNAPTAPPAPTLDLPATSELSQTTTNQSTGTGIDETASSIYSDDARSRPALREGSSSIYAPATSPPPFNSSSLPKPSVHQMQYTSLVSDVTNEEPLAANPHEPQAEANRWHKTPEGGDFLAAVKNNFPDTATPTAEPPTLPVIAHQEPITAEIAALLNPNTSNDKQAEAFTDDISGNATLRQGDAAGASSGGMLDKQAEAFADIVATIIESMSLGAGNNLPADGPDSSETRLRENVGTTPAQRPGIVPADSVLEITRAIPGSFST